MGKEKEISLENRIEQLLIKYGFTQPYLEDKQAYRLFIVDLLKLINWYGLEG